MGQRIAANRLPERCQTLRTFRRSSGISERNRRTRRPSDCHFDSGFFNDRPTRSSWEVTTAALRGSGVLELGGAGAPDALKECRNGLVIAAFAASEFGFGGDQFSPEGFGQDRLGQFLGSLGCSLDLLFD